MNKLFIGLVLSLSFYVSAYSQDIKRDTVFLSSAIKNTKASYEQWIGGQSHLYNGLAFKPYNNDLEGLPFFTPDWEDGSVYYDKELYVNVPLLYDLVTDKVIVSHYYSHSEMELISKKIDWFTISTHKFIHLHPSQADVVIQDGFYELLYDGKTKLFAKRQKKIEERIVTNKLETNVAASSRYFIYRDGTFLPVKKKSSIYTALNNKKDELQSYSKKNKLDFKRKFESSLIEVVSYYDQTTQE